MLKKLNKKRLVILLVSLSLALLASVGVTLALIIADGGSVVNTFEPSFVDCAVLSDCSIENTGDTEAYIRAAVIVTWKKIGDPNTVWAMKPVLGTDYTVTLGEYWEKIGDYYYYTVPVAYDAKTTELIKSYAVSGTPPTGYEFSIEIVAAAVQSQPTTAATSLWGVAITDNKITGLAGGS